MQWCPPGAFAERARDELIDVVVPLWTELDAETIHAGQFGLIQQFGAGVENIDIAAATSAGVWVANMPGLNAVDVAEHAVLLLLGLLRRLPESASGFDPGHWGDPRGEALAGSTVCIVGLGAVGSQLARRLDPFDVRLIGVRRDVRRGVPPTMPDIEIVGADRIHEALMAADAVILAASHEPGRPPLIDRAALAKMRPGARLVNVARGALIDEAALLEALDRGRLSGAGLDVFTDEPYPASGPLARHPKVIATAHNAALTTSYFRRAARALGEGLAAQLDGRRPPNALNAPTQPRDAKPRLGRPRCERRPSRARLPVQPNDPIQKGVTQMNDRPNIVLIHGAWADGSCWSGVIERLQADGFHVIAPQFPLNSLADDVARLRQVLEFQDGPTIVVGHSYGGQIMTALGADAPNVVGLVYVAAFGLDEGESLGELLSQGPVAPALAHLFTDARGFGWLSEDDFVNHFAADVDPTRARVLYAVQQPLATTAFGDVMGAPAWKSLPSWYLVAQNDEALPPDAERQFAARMGASTVEIPSSHVAMVSHPNEVADLIEKAANAVGMPAATG